LRIEYVVVERVGYAPVGGLAGVVNLGTPETGRGGTEMERRGGSQMLCLVPLLLVKDLVLDA